MAGDTPKKKVPLSYLALVGFLFAVGASIFDAWVRYPKLNAADVDWVLFGQQIVIQHNRIGLMAVLAILFSLGGVIKTAKGKQRGYTVAVAGLFLGLAFLFVFLVRNQIIFPINAVEAR